jgi:hypothetical protein
MDAVFDIMSDHLELTIDSTFGDRLSAAERIETLNPRRNTVWLSRHDSSPGRRRGPELTDELALSHSHAQEAPALPL